MKKVIFVADWKMLDKAVDNAAGGDVIILLFQVSSDWLESIKDKYKDARICVYDEYIDWQEELALREDGYKAYSRLIDMCIGYRGVSFADLFIPLYIYINNIIFHIHLYDKVTELERPQRYIGIGNTDEMFILRLINNERGLGDWQTLYYGDNRGNRPLQIYDRAVSIIKDLFREKSPPSVLNEIYEYLMMRHLVWRRNGKRQDNFNRDTKNKKNIVAVVGYNISYLETMLPVLKALINQGNIIQILAEGYYVRKRLKKEGLRFYTIRDFIVPGDNCIDRQEAINRISAWLDGDDRRALLYRGLNIWQVLKKTDAFKSVCNLRFPSVYPILDGLERFFSSAKPDALIVGTDRAFLERAGVRLATAHNIPSLHIQHGLVGYASFRDPIASKVCVWGNLFRERTIEFGCQKERIEVTGAPSLDGVNVSEQEIETFYRATAIPSASRIIAWFTTPLNRAVFTIDHALLSNEIMIALSDILKNNKETVLLIKLHPLDRAAIYKDIIREQGLFFGKRIIIKRDIDPSVIMAVANAGIIIQSTLIVDAIRAGLPIVRVGWLNIEGDEFFINNSLVYNARTLVEFSRYIGNILAAPISGKRETPKIFKEIVSDCGRTAVDNAIEVLNSIRKG